jgi:reactive intermediate/imine deaminase
MKKSIETTNAPAAIGTYSQAIIHRDTLYVSGQIPLDPTTMELIGENIDAQITQVLNNLEAIIVSAGANLDSTLKFTVYLTDLSNFQRVNAIMATRLGEPYPARAAVEVSMLPRGAQIEIDAIVAL